MTSGPHDWHLTGHVVGKTFDPAASTIIHVYNKPATSGPPAVLLNQFG